MPDKDSSNSRNMSATPRESGKPDRDKTKAELIRELEQLRKDNLRAWEYMTYLENLEAVDRVLARSTNLEHMMKEFLETVLWVFDCDRASLLYPCEPGASHWRVPMECTTPEYPGAMAMDVDIPMNPPAAEVFRIAQDSVEPVTFGPGCHHPVPEQLYKDFNVKAQMIIAVYPWIGKPWLFVLHQCSSPRTWTDHEARLFTETANRLSSGLSTLLFSRNLQQSEAKLNTILKAADDLAFILIDTKNKDTPITEFSPGAENIFCYKRDDIVGQPVSTIHPEDFLKQFTAVLEQFKQEKNAVNIRQHLENKTGRRFPASITLHPVYDESGRLTEVLEVVQETS